MQLWEYLHVETGEGNFGLTARSINQQELTDWSNTPLHLFLTQLGRDGWEMTGTSVISPYDQHLFFKRSHS